MYEEVVVAEDNIAQDLTRPPPPPPVSTDHVKTPTPTPTPPPRRQRHSSFSREEAYENVTLLDPTSKTGEENSGSDEGISPSKTFPLFAKDNFQGGVDNKYTSESLTQPLLSIRDEGDRVAALAVWRVVQDFMGNTPLPVFEAKTQPDPFVMCRLREELEKETSQVKVSAGKMGTKNERAKHTLEGMLKSLKDNKRLNGQVDHSQVKSDLPSADSLRTSLERSQYIIGNAILRPDIRDEIYCQICKQLTGSPDKSSHARGWILLALCLGCFPPSDRFCEYLKNFISLGPPAYSPFCMQRLLRTCSNGSRCQPPSWLELQMCKNGKPLMLSITLMDGKTKTVECDSATTAEELVSQMSKAVGLPDSFGFSIYVNVMDEVSSLGFGKVHIQDAISLCEQYTTSTGEQEKSAPWRLYFKKQLFVPWHDPSFDAVSTDLIYNQIIKGIHLGEYTCLKDADLISIAVKHYFINYGPTMDSSNLMALLSTLLPESRQIPDGPSQKFVQDVQEAFQKSDCCKSSVSAQKLKEEIVSLAMTSWPLSFSTLYEARQISDIQSTASEIIIAVNSTGIHILNSDYQVITVLSYPEIIGISCIRRFSKSQEKCVTLELFLGEKLVYLTAHAQELCDLVTWFLQELRNRSKYAVALDTYKALDTRYLDLNMGDLIELRRAEGKIVESSGCYFGKNLDAGGRGYFRTDCVYILKTLTKPTPQLLDSLKLRGIEMDTPQHVTLKKRISISI